MEYLENLEKMIAESSVYREFLGRLPLPFSNVYFEAAVVLVLGIYLVYRVIDAIRMMHRKKKLCRMKEEALQRGEEERLLREQEAEVQKGKIAAFMQFLQMQGHGAAGSGQSTGQTPSGQGWFKGIGTNRFRIGSTHSANDYEILMEEAKQRDEG